MTLYDTIGLHATLDKAISEEFEKAQQCLNDIQVPEEKKTPLRELMENLVGRKK